MGRINSTLSNGFFKRGLFFLLLIFVNLCSFADSYSQLISSNAGKVTLRKALNIISTQGNVEFFYSDDDIDLNQIVEVKFDHTTISDALNTLLGSTYLTERVKNDVILIKKRTQFMAQSQQIQNNITGIVYDENGQALGGATVSVRGTGIRVSTDEDGRFSLPAEHQGRMATVSFLGYATQDVLLQAGRALIVNLTLDVAAMNEIVVTGYQATEKRKSTGAIAQVDMGQIVELSQPTVDRILQGRVPGVSVVMPSGEVGAVPNIKIRGTSTLTGNTQPLWVLDGVILEEPVPVSPAEFNNPDLINRIGNAIAGINPEDIENINVLKDASATAIYGVKAAGGVVVLTTKKGISGKPMVNFRTSLGLTQRPTYERFNMMDSKERIELENYYFNRGATYYNADVTPQSVGLGGAYARYKSRELSTWEDFQQAVRNAQSINTDWFDVLFRHAISTDNVLNVSGGGERATYYASASYMDQQGVDIQTDNKRFTGLIKVNTTVTDRLNAEFLLQGSNGVRSSYPYSLVPSGISTFSRPTPRPFDYAINTSRTFSPYDEAGNYLFYKGHNDFYLLNILHEYENSNQVTDTYTYSGRVSLDYTFSEKLKLFAIANYSKTASLNETYYTESTNQVAGIRQSEFGIDPPSYSPLPIGGVIFSKSDFQDYRMGRLSLEYKPIANTDHDLELFAGGEYRANAYRGDNTIGWGYLHGRGRTLVSGSGEDGAANVAPYLYITDYGRKYASYFGVGRYTFKDRYTVSLNIRSDGSNLFGSNPKYRWQPAWSVSGRWNLHEEPAFNPSGALNMLSIRGSYGIQGFTNEQSTPQIIASFLPPAYWSGLNLLAIEQPANPNLRWEKTFNSNLGVDFVMFRGRLNGALDIYRRRSKDLITNTRISEINGFSYLPINFADVTNQGIELGLNGMYISRENFKWGGAVNFSYNVNEVTKVNLEPNVERLLSAHPYKPDAAIVGKPLNSLYSVRFAEIGANGNARFHTHDGDTTSAAIGLSFVLEDLVYSGPLEAPFTGGLSNFFTYGDFTLDFLFTYGIGNRLRMQNVVRSRMFSPDQNVDKELLNSWKASGDEHSTSIPHLLDQIGSNTHKDYWNRSDIRVLNGDYLRLKSLTLRYQIPSTVLAFSKLQRAFVQLEGSNLWLLADSRLKGYDPETIGYQSLPMMRSFQLSVNVSF